MKSAFIASEVVPFSKTGGLGDVSGVLPIELSKFGMKVKVFTPKYSSIDEKKYGLTKLEIKDFRVRVDSKLEGADVWVGFLPGSEVEIYFIDAPQFFNRGSLYTNDSDEDSRFIFFQKASIELIQKLNFKPDIIHCNDWQTSLIPLLIKDNYGWDKLFEHTKTVLTLHNIGYQGRFPESTMHKAEINSKYFYPAGPIEFEGAVNFLKCGIHFADILTTVSKKYAEELLTIEYAAGLHDSLFMRREDLHGILNGIDLKEWNPWFDNHIAKRYSAKNLSGKAVNKNALRKQLGLEERENIPVIGIASRMAYQKGFDILTYTIPHLQDLDIQWAILGSGEHKYEEFFNRFAAENKGKVGIYIGYNNELAHLIEAGSDMFLMPSHYEPCGLNQMYSLKYGTVPIVRKTGGLAETVHDWDEFSSHGYFFGNGFSFADYNGYALSDAIRRAVKYYHQKDTWRKIQMNGMKMDFSWKSSAKKYFELFKTLVHE